MYRLLIVDDEPILVEGLCLMLQETPDLDLEVYKAYSVNEALGLLEKRRMDIVLTDIEMPKSNGLALQERIQERWPQCKVIILTGYNNADYLHRSIRQGAVDYVLKIEGDEAIRAAVAKACEQLSRVFDYEQLAHKAREDMAEAMPSLQRDFLLEIIRGEKIDAALRAGRFERLRIPLHPQERVLLLTGRIDEWSGNVDASDKALLQYCVQNMASEWFQPKTVGVHVFYDREKIVWLLQPRQGCGEEEARVFVQEQLEKLQQSCKEYLKLSCSFALASGWSAWPDVHTSFDRLLFVLMQDFSTEKEVILSDRITRSDEHEWHDSRQHLKRLQSLGMALERGNQTEFAAELDGIFNTDQSVSEGIALEIYYNLVAMFISFMNRNRILAAVSERHPLNKWLNWEEAGAWPAIHRNFADLAKCCFQMKQMDNAEHLSEVIQTVQAYIHGNLAGDLSLSQLSELVYFSPGYLSRLFRQTTGENLTDYITRMRVEKAKALLTQTHDKIHRIGRSIGFESPSYFTKFLKKQIGMSPQEYRDSFMK